MARVRQIKAIKSSSNISKTNNNRINSPILKSHLAKAKVSKLSQHSKFGENDTIEQTIIRLNKILRFIKVGGLTYKTALSLSEQDDIDRAKTQLTTFMLRQVSKGVFTFIVRASGLYGATRHQVRFKFVDVEQLMGSNKTAKEIFNLTKLRTECSCGRFKYWYRYLATKGNYVLGVKEYRFPKVRNRHLRGALCKHQLKVITTLGNNAFVNGAFKRYLQQLKKGRSIRVTAKDKISTLLSSAKSKVDNSK